MAERGLAPGIPLGPFEGTPIYVYAGNGKNARLHARDSCSLLRTPAPRYFAVALDSAVLSRMCQSCAGWEQWGRPGTAVGIFLRTLTGLIDELDRYTAESLEEDLNGRDVATAAGLLACGDWPSEEDDEEAWDKYWEARFLRDDLLLPFWRGAADSIHAAFGVITRYPWLRDWAEPRLAAKTSYAEELRRQLGQFIDPRALLDAAAAYFLPSPELPVNDPSFAAFGDPGRIRMVLQQAWRQWQQDSADSWLPLGAKDWRVHSVLDSALGRKRKGRDEARQALSNLYQVLTAHLSGQQVMINGNALYAPSPSRLRSLSACNRGPGGAPAARRGTNDLDGGQNVGGQLGLPTGGCEEGAAITEGAWTPWAAAPSFLPADYALVVHSKGRIFRCAQINHSGAGISEADPVGSREPADKEGIALLASAERRSGRREASMWDCGRACPAVPRSAHARTRSTAAGGTA